MTSEEKIIQKKIYRRQKTKEKKQKKIHKRKEQKDISEITLERP